MSSAFARRDLRRIVTLARAWIVALALAGCGASTGLTPPDASRADAPSADTAQHVDVASSDVLGRPCGSAAHCDDVTWCTHTGCGFTIGTCVARPASCDGMWNPTCGCDARTYDSPCHAQRAGVSIAAHGLACLSMACATPCPAGTVCADCGSAGPQCVVRGSDCVRR